MVNLNPEDIPAIDPEVMDFAEELVQESKTGASHLERTIAAARLSGLPLGEALAATRESAAEEGLDPDVTRQILHDLVVKSKVNPRRGSTKQRGTRHSSIIRM